MRASQRFKNVLIGSAFFAALLFMGVLLPQTSLAEPATAPGLVHGDGYAVEEGAGPDAHAKEHSGGLPQLNPKTFPTQIFWLAVTFGIMYLAFSRKALPEISSVMENRRLLIDSDLSAAENLKEEAEEARLAYEESLDQARHESLRSFLDADRFIKERAAREHKAFQERSQGLIETTEKALVTAKKQAMEDMGLLAAEIARSAAEKIIGIKTDIKQAEDVVKSIHENKAKAA